MKYVYKIIAAIGGLLIAPAAYFLSMIYVNISSTALQLLIMAQSNRGVQGAVDIVSQNGGVAPSKVADSFSLNDIVALFSDGTLDLKGTNAADVLEVMKMPLITFVIILGLIAVCGIVTAVLAIVCKNNRKVYYSSLCGIGLCIMLKYAFESVAAPILDGTVSIASLMDNMLGGLVGSVTDFSLSVSFYVLPLMFAGIIVWTFIYNFTLPEDEKKKRKIMLGEAKEK